MKRGAILAVLMMLAAVAFTEEQTTYEMEDHLIVLGANLQKAIDESPLILVKFYAPWCGHCKNMAPAYAEVARTMALGEEAEGTKANIQLKSQRSTVQSTLEIARFTEFEDTPL